MSGRALFPGLALAAVLCVLWAGAAWAQDASGANKDPAALQRAADKGDAQAQSDLGMMYLTGQCVPKDLAKGAALLQKAADQGNAAAQLLLGDLYWTGHGVPVDYSKAAALFQKAADQRDAEAQNNLGAMHMMGHIVPQDFTKAAALFHRRRRIRETRTRKATWESCTCTVPRVCPWM